MSSPREIARRYQEALRYLDTCGSFDISSFREVNRLAGGLFSESELQALANQSGSVLSSERGGGGMEFLKREIRGTLQEGISTFGSLGF